MEIIGLAAVPGFAKRVHGDERPAHVAGDLARDLRTALTNLASYGDKLRAILEKDELSGADHARIHELS